MVTFLWRVASSPKPTATKIPFKDVPGDAWYKDAVLWAVEKNITAGTGDGTTFSPDMDCSCSQVVTFLQRFRSGKATSTKPTPTPIVEPLAITTQPTDVVCYVGDKVSFSVKAQGGVGKLTYRWEFAVNGSNFMPAESVDTYYGGYNTDTMTFTVSEYDFSSLYEDWKFRCVIIDEDGTSVTSDVVTMTEATPVSVATQPKNVYVDVDDTAEFSVVAKDGIEPYTYQWQESFDGTTYENLTARLSGCQGHNTPDLRILVQSNIYGCKYRCVITDARGKTVTSDAAAIYRPFKITSHP